MTRETEIKHMVETVKRFGARSTIGMLREAVDTASEEVADENTRAREDMQKAALVLTQAENRL